MNKRHLYILPVLLMVWVTGCDFIKMKRSQPMEPQSQEQPIARVYDTYLYQRDIEGINANATSSVDSANLVDRYVKSWIRKQLMIEEASNTLDLDEAELQRRMLDYKYALIVHEFKKYFINEQLNREVTQEEITSYYENNVDNFLLKQNIIRALYVKVPIEAPRQNKFVRLLKSNDEKDRKDIKSYCYQFATNYSLDDSLWINFDEIIANSPLSGIPNKVNFLRGNKYVETSDDNFNYYLKILDYKISDQVSPLEFVADEIKNIIINKRKVELTKELEESIYQEAIENNNFEVYAP